MLYANVNQGIAAAGGSPGSVGLPASQRPSVPAPTASGSELNLGLLPPYLPGLMDSAINGVNDFVAWGYYPLSVRTTQDSVPLYAFPPGNANGYTDARHYYFQSSMPVVYGMAQNSGDGSINGSRSATYGYTEAMYHHLGRGFQGFRSISSTTQGPSARRLRTTTTFHQKFPLTGRIEKVETLALATNKVIRSETDTWICDITNRGACGQPPTPTSNGGTIFAPQLDTQIVENFDLVTGSNYSTTSTVNAAQPSGGASGWDAYGNLTKQFVKLSDAVISEHRTTTTNSYSPDTSSWWLDRLNSSSVITSQTYSGTHPLPGGAVVPTRNITTSFAWNADHTPQSQTVSASGQTLTTAYDYTGTTAKGLPKSVTISGTGLVDGSGAPAPRTTTFTYTKDGVNTASQDGYFVLTTKNAAQHTSTTEHSTRDGQVTRQVDPNGLKVDNSYDPFGRLVGMSFFDASNAVLLPPVSIGYAKCTSTGCGSGYGDNGSGSQENAAWRVVRTQAGSPTTSDWFDVLGRNIKHTERGFAGDDFIETDTEYDALGTVAMQSGPFYQSEGNGGLTSWTYDALNRPLTKQSPGGELDPANGDVMTTYTYVGSTTNINVRGVHVAETCSTATNLCMNMSRTHDALGRLIKTVQGNGSNGGYATTSYWHDGLGNPVAARDAGDAGGVRAVITSTYNDLGHRIGLNDPDAGIWSFTYNALGELLTQTDARNVVTSHVYDSLGRLTTRTATNSNSTDPNLKVIRDRFIYDQVNGLGMLGTAMRFTGSSEASLGMIWKESNNYQANTSRLERQVSTLQGLAQAWTTSYTYDSSGRLETTTYPSGLAVKKSYTDYGLLQELSDNNTGGVYWHADAQDAWGNVSEETFLGSITGRHSSYASTGQSQQKQWKNGGSLLNRLDYSYDSFGNLKTQSTTQTDIDANETYTYDGLQRLTKTTRSGVPGNPAPVTYDYHPNGNLKFKSDYSTTALSAYTYDAGTCGPHAVTSVARSGGGSDTYTCDANGNVIGGSTLGASYDFNNQPWRVTREGSTAAFAYSADGAVFKSVTGSTTTWFGPGGYEESVVGGTRTQRHELGPVIVLRQNGSDSFKAVLRDRLGSQVMLVNGSPGQSTGLHASPNPSLDGRYTVRWNAMPGASRYELRESINNGLPSLIYNGAGLSWSPPSPKPIGTYRYTLRVCSPVCAADSAPVTEEVVPGAPTGLNLNPNPSSTGTFALSWSPVAGALLYQVEEKAETDADFHAVAMVSDPPGAAGPSWQASGKPTGDYQYRVRSCLTLCGNPSAIVTEVVTGGGGGQAPGAPFMNPPGAGSNTGQIALSWTPAAAPSPQPDYYAVQENGGYNIHVPSGTSLSLTRGNGTFTYKVRGCRNNPANPYAPFCGAYSNTVSVTVNASSIPAAPASISSTLVGCSEDRTNVEYAINWASSTGATSYELTETSDYDGDSDHTFTVFTTSQGFVHSTPPGETSITYSYTVKACNASGCSQDRGGAYACIGDDSNEPNGPDSTPIATAYDAFGKVRNGDYSDRPGGKLNLLPDTVRGFTGHQHVDDVRLIHMNGRVYDYQLGRFLSVDPIIQFPANSQSLNPYSYIMNNPLSGRDPSGYQSEADTHTSGSTCGALGGQADGCDSVTSISVGALQSKTNGADAGASAKGPGNSQTSSGTPADSSSINSVSSVGHAISKFVAPSITAWGDEGTSGSAVDDVVGGAKEVVNLVIGLGNLATISSNPMALYTPGMLVDEIEVSATQKGGAALVEAATFLVGAPVKVVNSAARLGKVAKEASIATKGGTYLLKDVENVVRKTGRTNDLIRRERELGRKHPDKTFEVDKRTDGYAAQRGREQILHDANPSAHSINGGLDRINGISPSNPRLDEYLEAGRELQ
ncbi:MAG TPA: RHS repeat-associated core domain-containing protein [Dokdonella sp.]|uniref:RHS repeat-associated core domain-containing protein n=1 Tax=Dokdonella sp. TaxID=2291710 RepID=UPI002B84A944|nr:RHS repeat-associated core domain-containing protein [Dokdonella sp.]HNV08733.1 RHS repeat-associated core domain-containing protein [Dokdonella sp.]HPW03219.1 RHS repeat-associated core domain-containing protein [Dokdonella sp.]